MWKQRECLWLVPVKGCGLSGWTSSRGLARGQSFPLLSEQNRSVAAATRGAEHNRVRKQKKRWRRRRLSYLTSGGLLCRPHLKLFSRSWRSCITYQGKWDRLCIVKTLLCAQIKIDVIVILCMFMRGHVSTLKQEQKTTEVKQNQCPPLARHSEVKADSHTGANMSFSFCPRTIASHV